MRPISLGSAQQEHEAPSYSQPLTSSSSTATTTAQNELQAASSPDDNDANAVTNTKRFQVPRACDRCKRLRRGCSEYRPCRRCIDSGVAEQCHFVGGSAVVASASGSASSAITAPSRLPSSHFPVPIHGRGIPPPSSSLGTGIATTTSEAELFGSSTSLPAIHHRLKQLVSDRLVHYCNDRFFDRLHPTIPILTPAYVARLRKQSSSTPSSSFRDIISLESLCVLVGMCAQVLLQTEEEDDDHLFRKGIITEPKGNLAYGRQLLEVGVSAYYQTLLPLQSSSPVVSIEICLFTFFLYACEAMLFHHSRAFRFLREATTMLLLFRPGEDGEETDGDGVSTRPLASHLFWVLLISERSHAIRYRRPITLQITDHIPGGSLNDYHSQRNDPSLCGFWSLTALFRPIDTPFMALLNREETATLVMGPSSPESLNNVEAQVNAAIKEGGEGGMGTLRDTQKANLRVTQLWLRIIIWQLRLRLGYLVEESSYPYQHTTSLTFRYPIEVARDLMLSTRDLPTESFRVHGVGLTEKLFDIVSALVDVLARIPPHTTSPSRPPGSETGGRSSSWPEDDLVYYLRGLIRKLPGGTSIYDDLLEKHIKQTLPELATRRPDIVTMGLPV